MRLSVVFAFLVWISASPILAEEQAWEWPTPEVPRSEIPAIAQPAVEKYCSGLGVGSFDIYNSSDEWPDDFKRTFEKGDKVRSTDTVATLKDRKHAFVNCGPRKMMLGGNVFFIVDLKTGEVPLAEWGE